MSDKINVEMSKEYFKNVIEKDDSLLERLTYVKDLKGNTLKVILKDRD